MDGSLRYDSRLKVLGTDAAYVAIPPRLIVEHFNVVRYVSRGYFSVLVNPLLDPFFLQAAEEGFSDGVVPAVSAPRSSAY
jgi:hypothetical protein